MYYLLFLLFLISIDLGRANVGILVDGVGVSNFGYLRRFVYNIIRMFTLSGTYVNIMVYGNRQYRVGNFVQVISPAMIRKLVMGMPKVAGGKRRTGAALQSMVCYFWCLFLTWLSKPIFVTFLSKLFKTFHKFFKLTWLLWLDYIWKSNTWFLFIICEGFVGR